MQYSLVMANKDASATSVTVSGVSASGAVGRALRNPLTDREISNAMNADLARLGMTRSEFADRINSKIQTIGWWFTNDAVPLNKVIDVINLFGVESQTFLTYYHLANKVLTTDLPKRSRQRILDLQRQLEGLEKLNAWFATEIEKYDTLNEGIQAFCEKYPVFTDVAKSRTSIDTGGITNIKIKNNPASLFRVKEQASLGQTNMTKNSLYAYSQTEANTVTKQIDELVGDGSPLPLANRGFSQFIKVANQYWFFGQCNLGFATHPADGPLDDPKTQKQMFITQVKACAFELKQGQLDEERNGRKRKPLMFIYDRFDMIIERLHAEMHADDEWTNLHGRWLTELFDDIRLMGIKIAWARNLNDIKEAIFNVLEDNYYHQYNADTTEVVDPEEADRGFFGDPFWMTEAQDKADE